MAQVRLSRQEAASASLPLVCMQCGAPATNIHPVPFTWQSSTAKVASGMFGLVGAVAGAATAQRMTVNMPLCMDHRNQRPSITWTGIRATEITTDSITLTGISDIFARALEPCALQQCDTAANPFAGPRSAVERRVPHASPLARMLDQPGMSDQPVPPMAQGQVGQAVYVGKAGPGWDQLAQSFTPDQVAQPVPLSPPPKSGAGWLVLLLGGFIVLPLLLCGGVVAFLLAVPRAKLPPPAAGPQIGPQFGPFGPQGAAGGKDVHDIIRQQNEDFNRRFQEQQDRIHQQQNDVMRRHEEFLNQMEEQRQQRLPGMP